MVVLFGRGNVCGRPLANGDFGHRHGFDGDGKPWAAKTAPGSDDANFRRLVRINVRSRFWWRTTRL